MADRIVRALHPRANLLLIACTATDAAREARRRHGLAPSSAAFLAQGMAAGALLGALQKAESTKVNLQVECDGPVRGLFVDADTAGRVRGYVRAKNVRFPGGPRFEAAPLLGGEGYVSVLRDRDGEFYRGSVGLDSRDLSLDLERYFRVSEQVDTAVQVEVLSSDEDELGWVGGVLVQKLPDGDAEELSRLRQALREGALERAGRAGQGPFPVLEAIASPEPLELLARHELTYFCPCTRERVLRALTTLPNTELADMIARDKKAEVNCDFCGEYYLIDESELRSVLALVDAGDAAESAVRTVEGEPKS